MLLFTKDKYLNWMFVDNAANHNTLVDDSEPDENHDRPLVERNLLVEILTNQMVNGNSQVDENSQVDDRGITQVQDTHVQDASHSNDDNSSNR